jgi:subtilisin family serine protease
VETYTLRESFTPEEGLDERVLDLDAERVHVLVQFTFDDPRVRRGDEARERDWEAEFDLSYCGSYPDSSGWENAHCFGVPTDRVEAFAEQEAVRSVTYIGPELKQYPELRSAVTESEEGVRLLVDTYPDAEVSAGALADRYGVEFVAEDEAAERAAEDEEPETAAGTAATVGRSFSTGPVADYETARAIASSPSVAWVGWYRPVYSTVGQSREHVGVGDLSGPGSGTPGPTGEGVLIGVMDSGIDDGHPHFDNTGITFSADWVDFGMPPEDQNSHGTHVAGTIAGNSTNGGTVLPGVAPDADLVVARIFKQQTWAVIAGRLLPKGRFNRLDNDAPGTMAAISNSWGMDDTSRATPLSRYDKFARSADRWAYQNQDTLLVFANGNACDLDPDTRTDEVGCANNVQSPALGKNVLSVGATYPESGTIGSYSFEAGEVSLLNDLNPPEDVVDLNNGRVKPEVLAPGVGITAPVPGGGYDGKRGTSMATPHVSGVVAVLAERHPGWDANTMRSVLITTTSPVRNPEGFLDGYGEVNARDALGQNSYESTQQTFHGSAYEGDRDVQATVRVPEGAHQLDASLAWMDPPKTAGGVQGFMFNRLDLVLIDPSGNRIRRTNAANVKKITVEDPEQGQWQVVVRGANVGPAFKPFAWLRSNPHRQSYDGAVRVVRDPPRLGVEVDHANLSGPTRAGSVDPSAIELDPGARTNVSIAPAGLGYVVSDVEATIDATGMSGVATCDGNDRFNVDAGDLSEGQSEPVEVCLEADAGAVYGTRHVAVRLRSTNGEDSGVGQGTKTVRVPVFVTESAPPDAVPNLRSTSHTVGQWTKDTTFRFAWDRPTDPGGSGVDGYTHALLVADSSSAASDDIRSVTTGRFWSGDPRSTALTVEKDPDRECYDPQRGARTCLRYRGTQDVNATLTGPSSRQELWFYIKARDNSSNVGPVERLGPFLVDLSQPREFDLYAAKPGPNVGTGGGDYFDRKGGYFTYDLDRRNVTLVWERPADSYSGVAEYYYSAIGPRSTTHSARAGDASLAAAPSDPANSNRTLTLRGLESGRNVITVTAIDRAGNRRQSMLIVCVLGDQPGVDCTTPGEAQRGAEMVRDAVRMQQVRDRLDQGMLGGPLGPGGCPGTYLCGGGPRPWGRYVADERVMLHAEGPGGAVVDRYLVTLEGGEVTEFRHVAPGESVAHSANVYTDAARMERIVTASDPADAVADAYRRGKLRVTGEGPANQVRFAALQFGASVSETATGVTEFLRNEGAADGGLDTTGPIVDPGVGTEPIIVEDPEFDPGTAPTGTLGPGI